MYSQGVRRGISQNYQLKGRNLKLFRNAPMTSATIPHSKVAKLGSKLGGVSFGIGTGLDLYGMYEYTENPNSSNAVHPVKGTINIGAGAYGVWGGPVGATVGIIYGGVDAFYPGGWPQAMEDNYKREKEIQKIVPDFKLFPKPAY